MDDFETLFKHSTNKYTADLTDEGLLDIVREAAAKAVTGPSDEELEHGWYPTPLGDVSGASIGTMEHYEALERTVEGVSVMIEQHCVEPDSKRKKQILRSLIRVAIGAGYHAALADKKHEHVASSKTATDKKIAGKESRHDKIRRHYYDEGMTQAAIAGKLGISKSTVSRALKD